MKKGIIVLCAAIVVTAALQANEKAPAAFQQAMKDNGATMGKLAKDADAKDFDAVAADAAALKATFMGAVGKHFTDSKNDDALAKCKDAYVASDNLEKAAKAKDEMKVADARKAVGGTCGACHMAHREKLADGTFEIK